MKKFKYYRNDVWFRSPTYRSWQSMKQRCFNKNNPAFSKYGGAGITVCSRWENSFQNFVEDMGTRPSLDYSIDRINNNKGYSKRNCRWATRQEQQRNKENSHHPSVIKIIDMISKYEKTSYKAAKLKLRKVAKWLTK